MNCRQVRDILPELASGELDNSIHLAAMKHISECSECQQEMQKYETALGALEQAFEPALVPEALNTFTIPVSRRTLGIPLRLGIATACLAVVLVAIFIAPRMFHQSIPVKQTLISQNTPNNNKPQAQPEVQPEKKAEDVKEPAEASKSPIVSEEKPVVKQEQEKSKPFFPLQPRVRKHRNYYASTHINVERHERARHLVKNHKSTPVNMAASHKHEDDLAKVTRTIVADSSPDSLNDMKSRVPAQPVIHKIARPVVTYDSYGNRQVAIAETDDICDPGLLDAE